MAKKKKADVGEAKRTSPAGFVWEGQSCTNPCRVTFGDVWLVDILFAQNLNGETWEYGVEWRTEDATRSDSDDLKLGHRKNYREMVFGDAVNHIALVLGYLWRHEAQFILNELDKLNLNPGAVHDLSVMYPLATSSQELAVETMAKAFTEWERRFREDPERFQSEAAKLLKSTPKTYGDACAPYFLKLLKEVAK